MKRYILFIVLLTIGFTSVRYAQISRTTAMGGLSYSIIDKDHSFNPYDLGGNPAWLYADETETYLKFIPSLKSTNGDYRRYYDPRSSNLYNLGFKGIKTMDTDGTFLGETYYMYDRRVDVNRTLKYNTYSGEAFFFTDTTTGGFTYNGPSVRFMYSFEPLKNLYAGAMINYMIFKGLKDIYSRADALYRDVDGSLGIAYKFHENFAAAVSAVIYDEQEKIESKSEDLMDVEIYNFRGETYSIRKRASSVNQKVRKEGKGLTSQIYWFLDPKFEIGLHGDLSSCDLRVLIPFSTATESFKEYEEGYTNFYRYSLKFRARYMLTDNLLAGASVNHYYNSSWSKNPARNLLLWEWEVNQTTFGIGGSYKFSPSLLIGLEYELGMVKSDSSKYIDSRITNVESQNHLVKIGAEYEMFENLFLRAGYNYGILEHDLLGGGKDVKYFLISGGIGLKIFKSFSVDLRFDYSNYKPDLPAQTNRSSFGTYIEAKLFEF